MTEEGLRAVSYTHLDVYKRQVFKTVCQKVLEKVNHVLYLKPILILDIENIQIIMYIAVPLNKTCLV